MSEASSDSSEKKHQPSKRRLDELVRDGQFLRAKEYYSGISLIAALICLYLLSSHLYEQFAGNFYGTYRQLHLLIHQPDQSAEVYKRIAFANLYALLPLFACLLIVFFLAVFSLGGFKFSKKHIGFKAERLSIIKNIKRIFSLQNAMELLKSILKIFVFLGILLVFLHLYQDKIFALSRIGDKAIIGDGLSLFARYLIFVSFGIALLASIDGAFNYYNYHKKAKMTDKEVKDEHKETDGNPQVKRKQRQNQMAIAMRSLQRDMPEASLIITNPTHYAVALRYHDGKDKAPKIIAKGADHMAMYIRSLAKKHQIPSYESPELARAIYFSGEVGEYVHPELYMAVAIVLSYILQLEAYQAGQGVRPMPISELQIPEAFKKESGGTV